MNKKLFAALLCSSLVSGSLSAQQFGRQSPLQMNPGSGFSQAGETATAAADPTLPFVESARALMLETKFSQAKEALRTAIRIAPMNLALWALYDEAVTADYVDMKRRELFNPVIERDIMPIFSINRIDSYIELGTLYVVGTLQNISKEPRQKIVLTAKMLDENKRELRSETGTLLIPERGLMPNESSLFEIPFKNFPPGGKSFRVQVSAYE